VGTAEIDRGVPDGLAHGRLLLEHAGQLLQRRTGGLEGVVELADVLQGFEELTQVQQERREHTDGHTAVEGQVAAEEQHDRDGDVADHLDRRHEHRDEPHRREVRSPVVVVDRGEDLRVAGLPAEGLHRLDPLHGLDEVHDDGRDRLSGLPVDPRRVLPEPDRQREQDRERDERHQAEPDVEDQQQHRCADEGQHRADEAVETVREELVDRVDVGRLPADHAAGRVLLVEGQRQLLEVLEHALTQHEQDVLPDPARHLQERHPGERLDDRAHRQGDDDVDHLADLVVGDQRRDTCVDADLHQVRDRQPGTVLEHARRRRAARSACGRAGADRPAACASAPAA